MRRNVKKRSQKRALKILQPERKIEIKRRFLLLRVVVFRFFCGQSIAFTARKLCFYIVIVMLLAGKRAAFRGLFAVFWRVFDKQEAGCLL